MNTKNATHRVKFHICKNILLLCTLLLGGMPLLAQTFTTTTPSGHSIYCQRVGWNGVSVSKVSGATYTGALVLPDSVPYNGTTYPVVTIDNEAFANCSSLTAVTIPQTVITLGHRAFENCYGLQELTYNPNVVYWGNTPFAGDTNITTLHLGKVVNHDLSYTFFLRSSDTTNPFRYLQTVTVEAGNSTYGSMNGMLFNAALDTLLNCPQGRRTATIPAGVAHVNLNAFNYCFQLDTVYYNATHATVYYSGQCDHNYNFLNVGSNVTSLPEGVYIPKNLQKIDVAAGNSRYSSVGGVLYNAAQDTLIYVPQAVRDTVTVPQTVTYIPQHAFQYRKQFTTLRWLAAHASTAVAFHGDSAFTTLIMGSQVDTLPTDISGGGARLYFRWLQTIHVETGNRKYSSVDGVLYNGQGTWVILCPPSKRGNVTLGLDVTGVADGAFTYSQLDTLFLNSYACSAVATNAFENSAIRVLQVGEEVDTLHPAFRTMPALQALNVHADNWTYRSLDGVLISLNGRTILRYPRARQGAYTMPATVRHVATSAFENCTSITDLDLTGLIRIDAYAFRNCTGFRTLTLPATVDTIGSGAFNGNHLDTLIWLAPNSIRYMMYGYYGDLLYLNGHSDIFSSDSLRTLIVGEGVVYLNGFSYCRNLTQVSLPSSLRRIGAETFKNCEALSTIVLPAALDTIDNGAFEGCSSLDSITLPDSLLYIGGTAFKGNTALSEITIPTQVRWIGDGAFTNCSSLHTMYFNSAHIISRNDSGDYVRSNGSFYYFPVYSVGATTGIFDYRFRSYDPPTTTHLSKLVIGDSVRNIFPIWYDCVDTLVLPLHLDTVFSIELNVNTVNRGYSNTALKYVYFNSKNLVHVGLASTGNNRQYIFRNDRITNTAFWRDYVYTTTSLFPGNNLRYVNFGDSVERIPDYCFKNCKNVRVFRHLELPSTVRYIGTRAFEGCTQILDAVIDEQVEGMGYSVFSRCSNMKKIDYRATNAQNIDMGEPPCTRSLYVKPVSPLDYNNVAHSSGRPTNYTQLAFLPRWDTIRIASNVKSIPDHAFGEGWTSTKDTHDISYPQVYIDNHSTQIQYIGAGAFGNLDLRNAASLIGDSLRVIGPYAFVNCGGVQQVRLPEGMDSVGENAFLHCQELDSVWLPTSLRALGYDAFSEDSSLTYLYYDCDSLSCTVGGFRNSVSLKSVHWGPHVRHLPDYLFYNSIGLARKVLPEGLLSIGRSCFGVTTWATLSYPGGSSDGMYYKGHPAEPYAVADSVELSTVVLPSTLQYVGRSAFYAYRGISSRLGIGEDPDYTFYYDTIICRSTTPPILDEVYWEYSSYSRRWSIGRVKTFTQAMDSLTVLVVPCGSVALYSLFDDTSVSNTARWGQFLNIVEQVPYSVALSVNDSSMGSVAMECTGLNSGNATGVRVTATPAAGHHFVAWSDSVTTNPRIMYLQSDTAVQAIFAWGLLYTVQVSANQSSRGTVSGSGTYVQGSLDTLTATSNTGYYFAMWSDSVTDNPRVIEVNGNLSLQAIFLPLRYTLQVTSADTNMGTVSGGGTYDYYTNCAIRATAKPGHHFTAWQDGNTVSTRALRLVQDSSFTAYFARNSYVLSVTCDSTRGTVTGGGSYLHGDTVTLTATAYAGYLFSAWSDGNTDNPRTMVVTGAATLQALFEAEMCHLVLAVATPGSGTVVAARDTAAYGDSILVTATPATGYHFDHWHDGSRVNPRYVVLLHSYDTVTATFVRNSYVLSATCDSTLGSVSGGGTYLHGDTATLVVTVTEPLYEFVSWSDGNTENPRSVVVTGNMSLTATIGPLQHTVQVLSNDPQAGIVTGSGRYAHGDRATLTATPNTGYYFHLWQETGNTESTVDTVVTQDITLTAQFDTLFLHVDANSEDESKGTVSGSGTYQEGSTVVLTATPAPGHYFGAWSDGSRDNPYIFTLMEHTTLIAFFAEGEAPVGIAESGEVPQVQLSPNPAREQTVLHLSGVEGTATLEVVDMQGRTVQQHILPPATEQYTLHTGSLPAGLYLLQLHTSTGKVSLRLVIQ